MKKLSILLSLALAVGFVACDDIEDPMPPQSNPQESIMSADGLTVGNALPASLSLADYVNANTKVPVLNIVEVKDMPEDATLDVTMQIADNENFEDAQSLACTVEDNVVYADPTEWDNIHRSIFGKSPAAKTTYARFDIELNRNGAITRFGDKDTYFAATSVEVTPIDLGIVIQESYYIITDPMFDTGWEESAIKLGHSDQGVYDDPVFTSICTLPAGSIQFMGCDDITKAKADEGNEYLYAYGTAGSSELVYGELAQPITISKAGQYTVSINMMEGTYSIRAYSPKLYAVGGFNSWSHNANVYLYERSEGVHSGFIDMTAAGDAAFEFKFSSQTDWNGTNYGIGDKEGTLDTDGGAKNLSLDKGGIYYFKVNTSELTYTATEITSVGIIGDATPGGWSDDTDLTYQGNLVWTLKNVTLVGGKEYKFRFNDGWDLSLGGSLNNLDENNGANIVCPADGKYSIILTLTDNQTWTAIVSSAK